MHKAFALCEEIVKYLYNNNITITYNGKNEKIINYFEELNFTKAFNNNNFNYINFILKNNKNILMFAIQNNYKKIVLEYINTKNVETFDECYICYDKIELLHTNCEHTICYDCLFDSLKIKNKCGYCRQDINNVYLLRKKRLYNE